MVAPKVAIVGDGQLARMLAEPAAALGIGLRLLAGSEDSSAAQVIGDRVIGDYRDLADLREVAVGCDVMTFDHEHVPGEHLANLGAEGVAVRPGPEALIHAQDKAVMRAALDDLGVPTPRHAVVSTPGELEAFGFPCVLKTPRGGYDGKGVWFVDSPADAPPLPLLAEEVVDFRRELSALVARRPSGDMVTWPVVESVQVDGICREVTAPAPDLDPARAEEATRIARVIAEGLDVTGVLAVELFETSDGRILVNELAMRPHNTGHWTQDGAVTSQFENHLRAVLDLPLGSTEATAPWTVMVNILGGRPDGLAAGFGQAFGSDPGARVHLYGKEIRPGRKVGHVNVSGTDLGDCQARARASARYFSGE